MKFNIFYSWQSDLPNSKNRSLILNSLKEAIDEIKEEELHLDLSIDRDTFGLSGSPDIVNSIFDKIRNTDVFISDVSIINKNDDQTRKTSNPNVLIETGYAASSLDWDRIILVFNSEFGSIEQLPFDLRSRRILAYDSSKVDKGKNYLRSTFKTALKAVIEDIKQRNFVLSGRGMANDNHVYTTEECITIIENLPKIKLLKRGEFLVNEMADGFTESQNNPYVFIATPSRLGEATIGAGGMDGGWRKIGSSITPNREGFENIEMNLYSSDNALHANFPIHIKFYDLEVNP